MEGESSTGGVWISFGIAQLITHLKKDIWCIVYDKYKAADARKITHPWET